MQSEFAIRDNTPIAYCLRWVWTGWPSNGLFPDHSSIDWRKLEASWEDDGIRTLEYRFDRSQWSVVVSTKPIIAPTVIVSRLKGRIDHAYRLTGNPLKFSRKVALRSLGENTQQDVDRYIAKQVDKQCFVDETFSSALHEFTRVWSNDASRPLEVSSGRYWYRLHLVLGIEKRDRIRDLKFLGKLFEMIQEAALDSGYVLSALSVMTEHVHIALRGLVDKSPDEIARYFQATVELRLAVSGLWQPSYYVGTFGAYNMNIVRLSQGN